MASRKTNKQLNDRAKAEAKLAAEAKQQVALKRTAKKRLQKGTP